MKPSGTIGHLLFRVIPFLFVSFTVKAQYEITAIYTDYTGFWASSSTVVNSTKPVNNHNLLAFTWNGTTFSTGVDDAKLTTNGVTPFAAKNFRAFPINSVTGDYIGLGQLADGVSSGAAVPAPFPTPATAVTMASFLTDGVKGLNIGTGIANITAGQLRFNLSSLGISASAINDGVPDVVVTQVAAPSLTELDSIYFIDAAGNVVGNRLSINHASIPIVGKWNADFYTPAGTLGGSLTNTERDIRLWAADLTSFGIHSGNVGDAVALIYRLKGSSDVAFVAFNVPSISVATQLTVTTQPGSASIATCCNNSGGTALSPQPAVQVRDGSGNIISQAGITVTVSVASGPSTALGGTLTATTNTSGLATFTNLVLPCETGTYTLNFTSSNLDPVTSGSSTVVKPAFYPKSGSIANLSGLSSWASNTDGTGTEPTDFSAGKEFILTNSSGSTSFSSGANWTITGKLTVPSGKTLTITSGTTTTLSCDVNASGIISAATGASLVMNGTSTQTLGGTNNLINLTINNAAGVNLAGNTTVTNTLALTAGTLDLGANTLTVNGDITRVSGNITAATTGATIVYSGSSAQSVPAAAFSGNLYNCAISNAAGVTINNNLTVSNTLSLLNGKLAIGVYNISAGTATGGSTTAYVQANGTGKMSMNVPTGAGSAKTFPVGGNSYSPVKITNNNAAADVFSVRILNDVYDSGTQGFVLGTPRIKNTWDIEKTGANTGSGISFRFDWQPAQNYNVMSAGLFHYQSGAWVKQSSGTTTWPTATSLNYTAYTGTFSPFAIGDNSATLPLSWISFTAMLQEGNSVVLNWKTADEFHTKDFIVQHSADGSAWTNIGSVSAAPDNNHSGKYSFLHNTPAGINYYRILQTDIDGRYTYSEVRLVKLNMGRASLVIINNPLKNGVLTMQVPESQMISLLNTAGKLVWQKKMPAGLQSVPIGHLPKGIYIVQATGFSARIVISNQ